MPDTFSAHLEEKINGLVYYSESDNPYTIENLHSSSFLEVPAELASLYHILDNEIGTGEADTFFDHILQSADPSDSVLQANAQRTKELYDYLQRNLTDIKIYRIKQGARVTIYIVGTAKDGRPVALKTIAVET